jgi:hypothetical protein
MLACSICLGVVILLSSHGVGEVEVAKQRKSWCLLHGERHIYVDRREAGHRGEDCQQMLPESASQGHAGSVVSSSDHRHYDSLTSDAQFVLVSWLSSFRIGINRRTTDDHHYDHAPNIDSCWILELRSGVSECEATNMTGVMSLRGPDLQYMPLSGKYVVQASDQALVTTAAAAAAAAARDTVALARCIIQNAR